MKPSAIIFPPLCLLLLTLFGQPIYAANKHKDIEFIIPQNINPVSVHISYFFDTSAGGFGSFVRTEPERHRYSITQYKGKLERLRGMVHSPGYQIVTFDIDANPSGTISPIKPTFKPLPLYNFKGRIVLPENISVGKWVVSVSYMANWGHTFYHILGGRITSLPITSAIVDEQGKFSLLLPDFDKDPVTHQYKKDAYLQFKLRQQHSQNHTPFRLKARLPADNNHVIGLPIADYRDGVVFDLALKDKR